MKKYKIIIVSILVILIIVLAYIAFKKDDDYYVDDPLLIDVKDVNFKLKGNIDYELNTDDDYYEDGFIARLSDGTNLSDFVTITEDKIVQNGKYKIKYELKYKNINMSLYRNVTIVNSSDEEEIEEKFDNSDIIMVLKGEEETHVLVGNQYKEDGIIAIDKKDGNISKNVLMSGIVNTDLVGEYIIKYSVENSRNELKTIERKVIVYDYDYKIDKIKRNDIVSLKVTFSNNIIKYVVINGEVKNVLDSTIELSLIDNNEYNLKFYDVYNYYKEELLNFVNPNISCIATLSMEDTLVTTSTPDNNIVKYNYYFNDEKYEDDKNSYKISGVFKNVFVEAINDKDNSKKVACQINDYVPDFESGLKELKYDNWNYYLYIPENTKKNEKKPLIVFLHGSGEQGNKLSKLDVYGFSKYIKNGQKYDAFILEPQLPSGTTWVEDANKTMKLVKKIVSDYNIDSNKISLSGFSLGAIGIPTIMSKNQNYFSCVVMIAVGGNKKGYASYFKNIPVRFYTGSKDTRLGNSSQTKQFIAAVKKVNSNVQSVVYPNKPHNVVDLVLKDGTVPKWMISQIKK